MPTEVVIKELKEYGKKYGILRMLWMGGEPLLRKDVLERGVKLFPLNVINQVFTTAISIFYFSKRIFVTEVNLFC